MHSKSIKTANLGIDLVVIIIEDIITILPMGARVMGMAIDRIIIDITITPVLTGVKD